MSWLVTSPHGPLAESRWWCEECEAWSPPPYLGADPAAIREQASEHLKASGHRVTVIRGTSETLYPVATVAGDAA